MTYTYLLCHGAGHRFVDTYLSHPQLFTRQEWWQMSSEAVNYAARRARQRAGVLCARFRATRTKHQASLDPVDIARFLVLRFGFSTVQDATHPWLMQPANLGLYLAPEVTVNTCFIQSLDSFTTGSAMCVNVAPDPGLIEIATPTGGAFAYEYFYHFTESWLHWNEQAMQPLPEPDEDLHHRRIEGAI